MTSVGIVLYHRYRPTHQLLPYYNYSTMVVNIIKLGILFIGIIGYFTRSQELGSNKEIQQAEEHHREKRNIYLNSKAPILIGSFIYNCYHKPS